MSKAGFVSILGRPNAGKSTLLNSLVGQKLAIVSSRPQTTRAAVEGVLTTPEAQVVFIDTPGIHKSDSLLNKRMMDEVRSHAACDVVLFLIDALAPFSPEDAQAVDLVKKMVTQCSAPALAVVNKIDALREKTRILELIARYRALHEFVEYIPVSALTGEGLDALRAEIAKRLPEGEPLYPEDRVTDQPERYLAAEIVREQILELTRDEVPHAVAVTIEDWKDEPALLRIAAAIYVERPGQKAILIGRGGTLLKKIGTLAREEMERMFSKKVFLQTVVKVRPRWREDAQFLRSIDWRGMAG
ncbi:MAG TPA: GTPase Era [Bryobacteraceae bacterium]